MKLEKSIRIKTILGKEPDLSQIIEAIQREINNLLEETRSRKNLERVEINLANVCFDYDVLTIRVIGHISKFERAS